MHWIQSAWARSYVPGHRVHHAVELRHLENKLGIKGSPTCELVFKDAPAELVGKERFGLIKYVMALMNSARLGVGAQSVGIADAAYREALKYAEKEFNIPSDDLVYELADNALGAFYPSPPRCSVQTEKIVRAYIADVLCPHDKLPHGKFDIFATEGATAAMIYVFNSLKDTFEFPV